MVGNDLKERGTRITVHDVESHVVAVLLELGLVRLHALDGLLTQLTKKLVLLLRVDREGTRHPRAREDVSGKDSHKEDVATLVDGLAFKHIVERLVTGLSAVEGKKDLGLITTDLLTRNTDNVLLASLSGDARLVERVAALNDGSLGNLRLPALDHLLTGCSG